ncbi:thioredoxin [Desulfurispora thermophila]|uniref:thioredoxin n=1 Tax=Desulfurispora thermophila TaxID=265470 RepID=UPI000366924D|nr:thioredoxin [Desulfurispora thermophila]
MASDLVKALSDADFKNFVTNSPVPVLVDFWAGWCGPCKMIAPLVEELAAEYQGRLAVAKLNVDDNRSTAAEFKVISIPTLIMFKNGQEVDRSVGFKSKRDLIDFISKHV